ncbi:MAG: fused MFS/spermidine synthase [Cellvibrionaceae bacterium]|nr:fused MFS/spermidine synthase [Cellvibrionaceae bacterium]
MKNKQYDAKNPRHSRLDKLVFYGTVSVTGAAVMMVELLGTRIIGPYYGVSLIVWSSLLSVSLLALSMGYAVGGRYADKPSGLRLPMAIVLAAISIALVPVISETVQVFFNRLGLRWGALSSALVLFTPALFFLGTAGPFVIRLATRGLENVGATAGNVYAISTVGSVIGTLLLGFYLLPIFGTRAILQALSFLLLCLSVLLAFYEQKRFRVKPHILSWSSAVAVFILMFFLQGLTNSQRGGNPQYQVLFEEETHYGWVRVVDQTDKEIRWLMSDASTIGAEHLPSGKALLGYQSVVRLIPWFRPQAKNALLIGLGAGHLVNDYAKFGIKTDAIEIDPAVAKAAVEYFNFKPTGKVIVGDARYQVKKLKQRYDFIIHDCFTGGAEPFHLLSQEMLWELKQKLKPGGILVVNFVGFTDKQRLQPVNSLAKTLDSIFSQRSVFVPRTGQEFSDYIFVVSNEPLNINKEPDTLQARNFLSQRTFDIDSSNGTLITDDYNPLEFMQIAKAEYYREILVQRVGQSVLFH